MTATVSRSRATVAAAQAAPVATRKRVRRADAVDELTQRLQAAADIKRQVDALEIKLQEQREWFLKHLQRNGDSAVSLGDFTVSMRSRAKWEYSQRLHNELLQLQNEQKLEQRNGTALNTPTEYVSMTFKAPK